MTQAANDRNDPSGSALLQEVLEDCAQRLLRGETLVDLDGRDQFGAFV